MRVARLIFSAADVRRKLRALSALAENAGATEHERANAEALKARLQRRLKEAGVEVTRSLVGNYITSLDMACMSVTVCRADDEILRLWDAPVRTPALRWSC